MAGTRLSGISCCNLDRVAGEACARSFGSRVRPSPVELLSPVDREAVRATVLSRPPVDLRAVDVTGSGSCTPRTFGLVPSGTLGADGRRHRTSDDAPGVTSLRITGHQRVCVNVFVEMTGNYGSENRCNVNGRY